MRKKIIVHRFQHQLVWGLRCCGRVGGGKAGRWNDHQSDGNEYSVVIFPNNNSVMSCAWWDIITNNHCVCVFSRLPLSHSQGTAYYLSFTQSTEATHASEPEHTPCHKQAPALLQHEITVYLHLPGS